MTNRSGPEESSICLLHLNGTPANCTITISPHAFTFSEGTSGTYCKISRKGVPDIPMHSPSTVDHGVQMFSVHFPVHLEPRALKLTESKAFRFLEKDS